MDATTADTTTAGMERARTDLVVGFDGSLAAESAVDWAASEASSRGVRLRVVCANPYVGLPYSGMGAGALPPIDPLGFAEDVAKEGRLRAAKAMDESLISTVAVPGGAAHALVSESGTAAMVVVGHPSKGRVRELVTGSVAFAVAAHADCDVAVIPYGVSKVPGPGLPVVVGVDGAPDGERAAQRAAEIATRWGADLEIVQAWRMSSLTGWPGALAGTDILSQEADYLEGEARTSVDMAAAAVRATHPDLTVRTIVIEEHPASALIDIAERAGLLVVGTRGLGGLERLMLGSVSRAVIHHAVSPVLIVRT